MAFIKATKTQGKARVAFFGPSGAGKTYTALVTARELAGGRRIAVIDTENASASKYSDLFDFDVNVLTPPFTPDKYIDAIHDAENGGYGVLIIDSLSHAWSGQGGILEMVDTKARSSNSGNSYVAWREVTPKHNALVDALVHCKIHLIVTMRSKMEYAIEENDRGKKTPRKIGLAPVQRDGVEYEFDVTAEMNDAHALRVTKSRCFKLADYEQVKPDGTFGRALAEWLSDGAPEPTEGELTKEITAICQQRGVNDEKAVKTLEWLATPRSASDLKNVLAKLKGAA